MFDRFPFSNDHELNLDWILKILAKLKGGTKDQVLTRLSNKPLDFGWKTMSGGGGGGGATDYNDLGNKPSINGVTLSGNKTAAQLGITPIDNYNDLNNKPRINGVELSGNKTAAQLGITGADEIFIATYGSTLYSDITDALTAGKMVFCEKSGMYYQYSSRMGNVRYFGSPNNNIFYWVTVTDSNIWNSGSSALATPYTIAQEVSTWLSANVDPDTGYVIDKSLSISDAAADAKVTGDTFDKIVYISPNLLDPSLFQEGKYLVAGGGLGDNANLTASGFFPVTGGATYYFYKSDTYSSRMCFYTSANESDYIYNSLADISGATMSYTVPATAKYARLSTNKNMIKDMGVYPTSGINRYIPYERYLVEEMGIRYQLDTSVTKAGKAADAKAVRDMFNAWGLPKIEKTYALGGDGVVKDERLNLTTGAIVTNSSGQVRSDWIEAPTSTRVMTTGIRYICLYDEDYNYLGYYNLYTSDANTPDSWSGNYSNNLTQIQKVGTTDVAFIRFWGDYQNVYNPAMVVLNDDDYKIVCFGDSIFGNNEVPYDLGTQIQNGTWLKTANCGYGGTTARVIPSGNMAPLGLPSIVDCITSGDYTSLGTPAHWRSLSEYRYTVPTLLFPLIDFSKVDVVTIAYGTNDWNTSTPIDNQNDPLDTSTFCGGLRYAIENLLTAYPNLTIILLSPIYRYWGANDDSNSRTVNGKKLMDFVTAMKNVAEEYALPFFDNYNTAGLNKFTAPAWLRDGTHLNRTVGVQHLGHRIAGEISTVFKG